LRAIFCYKDASLLLSAGNFSDMISKNRGFEEVTEYIERVEVLDMGAGFKYNLIRQIFPEEGLPPL
jgi:hypothetical protein